LSLAADHKEINSPPTIITTKEGRGLSNHRVSCFAE